MTSAPSHDDLKGSSKDDLKGFPMVFAYTEAMLNNQIAKHHEDMFPEKLSFEQPEEEWGSPEDGPDWSFNANQFESPRISFDVPQLSNGAKLNIKIVTGTFKYWTIEHRRAVEKSVNINGHTLSIVTPVKQRRHEDFTDANFSIEAIYADLSQVESADIDFDDRREVRVSGSMKAGLEAIIKRGLKDWVEEYAEKHDGALPMVFGGTRIPKVVTEDYRLRPTGCTYSVTQNRDRNGHYISGALNMLLQIDGEEIWNTSATGVFDRPLPRSNSDEGVLVISSYALSKKIILPGLREQYGDAYIFEARKSNTGSNGDVILSKPVKVGKGRGVTISTNRIEGEFVPGCYRLFIDLSGNTFHWSGRIASTSKNHIDLKFSLEDGKLKVTQGEMVGRTDHNESLIGRIIGDIITLGFDEILRAVRECDVGHGFGSAVNNLSLNISEALEGIILPGGKTGIFDYVGVEVKEEPNINGYANLFLYAKFDGLDGK